MNIKTIGGAGVMVGDVPVENGRSAARDGDFSIVDAFVDVGDSSDAEEVILAPIVANGRNGSREDAAKVWCCLDGWGRRYEGVMARLRVIRHDLMGLACDGGEECGQQTNNRSKLKM
jgi:hypothetical protein